MIGALLQGRYRIDAEIDRGGMSVVYRAHDTLLDRAVAVKVLSAAAMESDGPERLLREARAAARLNHPNLVSVYDAGEAEGSPFVVMELVEGGSLHAHRPPELERIVVLARQVCAALDHAHSHGLVHRDLKPENVLLAADGTAKLSDLGLARNLASRISDTGMIVGTVFYLAPEQALGGEIDGRADLYSLGVLLYELTTGQLPFTGDDPLAVISQHLHAPVVPARARNAAIPPALDALISRLLSKDPEARPESAAEVLRILNSPEILDSEAIPAREVSVLERIEHGRMVGRERELQQARALWSQAVAGQGRLLLISGEPGIGKTRLVQTLATQVQVSGGRALQGACYAEGGMPYAPFAQLLRELLAEGGGGSLALPGLLPAGLPSLAPLLRLDYPEFPPEPSAEQLQAERQRLFRDLTILFTTLAAKAPLLLALEDIHWADRDTLSLFRHLARDLRRQRVLLVATYRDAGPDEAGSLPELLLEFQRERLATRLKLLRLNREQTGELLAALFAEEITPEFLDGIYTETEGNPFFIEEVCRALVDSGPVYFADGRWHRPDMEELGIPPNVSVAIRSRVRALPEAAQKTLHLAAVLGRTFALDTLAAASDLDREWLLDCLRDAERAQLIEGLRGRQAGRERGGSDPGAARLAAARLAAARLAAGRSFAFAHGLIPSTLLAGQTAAERRRLHQRAAEAIERVTPAELEALSYHYDRAGNTAKAIHYLLKAGDRARGLYAFQEAIGHYHRALALLKEAGQNERAAQTLLRLGLVHTAAFEADKARQAYDEAFDLWARPGEAMPPAAPAVPPRVLRLAVEEPLALDPARITDDVSTFVVAQLFEGLVRMEADYTVLPAAAARWRVAEQGRRYTFRLRDDLRWSDGSPLTAHHFAAAWRRNLRLDPPAPLAHLLYAVENARAFAEGRLGDPEQLGVRVVDDQTLEIRLEEPIAYLPQLLAQPIAYPLPPSAGQEGTGSGVDPARIVGNGAYRLEGWQRGEGIVLGRNPFYCGRFPGNAERVECTVVRDFDSALARYAAGALDVVNLISADPGVIARARAAFGPELVFTPQASTFSLTFRTDRPPLDDVRVRQALVHAVDRDALLAEASEGQYLPAHGGFVPPCMPAHSTGIGLPYDVARAQELLARAGYPGGQGFPRVSWLYSAASAGEPVVPFLQRAWRKNLGLELPAQGMEWGDLLARRRTDPPQLSLIGWSADLPDPDGFLRATYHSREGINAACCGWRSARFDALVEEAARVPDPTRRMAYYREADRILVSEEAAIMPLFYAQGRMLRKPWVTAPPVPPAMLNLKEIVLGDGGR